MNTPVPSFFTASSARLLLFGGKGGVGKTSCATASAFKLAYAAPDRQFLLVSTDPAHSLADSVAESTPPPNLQVIELDAAECLADFKRQHGDKLYEIAARGTFLDHEDISRFLALSLPGLDEVMAALEISRWAAMRRYETIVVDTAPTGHTLRLLSAPTLLQTWLGALDALLAKHRYMRKVYKVYTKAGLPDELDVFLAELNDSVRQLEALLRDREHCRFVPVMLADEIGYSETGDLLHELQRFRVPVADIVVNRLLPPNECPICTDGRAMQNRVLAELCRNEDFSRHALWGIPLYAEEIRGAAGLHRFWAGVRNLADPPVACVRPRSASAAAWVDTTSVRPPGGESLLFFAGKGGVGKTTLACATSLHLARETPDREVLLCSIDPAHSLSECLQVPVGPAAKRICRGLTAIEIDAGAEFEAFRAAYVNELRGFLESHLGDVNLALDQPAMERIVDLAPPGIDELMALIHVMNLCEERRYATMVVDTAPTGHLIRLLEMPDLLDSWLKAFFGVFLKYERLLRLPKLTQLLVELSKSLKRLRALLADPSQSGLFAVSILTDMSLAETTDLLAACERLHVNVPALFLNAATPPGECTFCHFLRHREAELEDRFRRAFPATPQTVVYRRGDPRGLTRLTELGHALYTTPVLTGVPYA